MTASLPHNHEPIDFTDPAPRLARSDIARHAARMLPHGAVVNLGIGIPSLCADFVPEGVQIRYQAENGVLGYGELLAPEDGDPDLIDASGQFTKMTPGMAFFDSAESFAMIRGGHIDATVLGALQVSEWGDLANWMLPSRGIGSIGGGMDLAANTKRVIVAMEHTTRRNEPKILQECSFPLTAQQCVTDIVTDIAVISVTEDGLMLNECAPGWGAEDVQALTAATLLEPTKG
ncbi:MAG: 3-oxoacid CoA-transferase subunit B [Chloroflexi bacterium]|nr:3-oxoacid CoA-transferase subunit B [Chloroflexota bacterium]